MATKEIAIANKIITSQYRLNDVECRLVFHLIGRIKKEDKNFVEYKYTMKELLQAVGMTANNVKHLEAVMDSLFTKIIKIDEEEQYTKYHWFDTVTHIKEEKSYILRFNEALKPYLLRLTKDFSLLDFQCIMKLPIHSRRIYMLAKKDEWQHRDKIIPIAELRELLELGKGYAAYKNLRVRIIEPAVREINEISDITLMITPDEQYKIGRTYQNLIFRARKKPEQKQIGAKPPEAAKPKPQKTAEEMKQMYREQRIKVNEKIDKMLHKRWEELSQKDQAEFLSMAEARARGMEEMGIKKGTALYADDLNDLSILAKMYLGEYLVNTNDREYCALVTRFNSLGQLC